MQNLIEEACRLLASNLADRSLPFDFAEAELRAVETLRDIDGNQSTKVIVLTGSTVPQAQESFLDSIPDLNATEDFSKFRQMRDRFFERSAESKTALIRHFSTCIDYETIIITMALTHDESEELSRLLKDSENLCRDFVVGDRPSDERAQFEFSRLSLIWRGEYPRDAFYRARDAFFNSLGIPAGTEVESLEPLVARVEVVSLRTAAAATSSAFDNLSYGGRVFDINSRRFVNSAAPVEFAVFTHAAVLPSASWKLLIDNRLYVEEAGYVEHGRLNLIECWPDFGATWSIRKNEPTFRLESGERFTFLLGGDVAHYHLLLNWLPRLRVLDHPYVKRLVGRRPQVAVSSRFSDKEIGLINRLIGSDVDFLFLQEAGIFLTSNLVVPRFFSHHELIADVANWYREKLKIGPVSNARRIYISRSDARMSGVPRRKVVNEAEVIACLSARGFEAVELSNKSMDEQIEIFRHVEFVVGPHGAGFANMVFAPPGALAIVIENSWAHTFIADMLDVSGHRASILIADDEFDPAYEAHLASLGVTESEVRRSRDMRVDCKALAKMIDESLATID